MGITKNDFPTAPKRVGVIRTFTPIIRPGLTLRICGIRQCSTSTLSALRRPQRLCLLNRPRPQLFILPDEDFACLHDSIDQRVHEHTNGDCYHVIDGEEQPNGWSENLALVPRRE